MQLIRSKHKSTFGKRFFLLILLSFVTGLFNIDAQIRNKDFIDATQGPKYNWDLAASQHLVLENRFGQVTANEIEGLKLFLLAYDLPTHNGTNYYFRNRSYSYMMEWVFEQDEDLNLLQKAIDVARAAIAYRNDNICDIDERYTCYAIDFSRTVAPVWPNYKKDIEIHDEIECLDPGAGVFAGVPVITVPIRMVANHPELWSSSYKGQTYQDIANELIEEALLTVDYTYETMVGDDNLIRYSELVNRDDWPGFVFIYNRVFPVISGTIPLIEALEVFELYESKVQKIDQVNQAMLSYFLNDFTVYEKNGREVCYYPYSDVAQSKNPNHAEDFVHGSLESRDLQLLFKSKRYDFPERYIQAIANTVVDVCYKGNGVFADRLNGEGTNSSSIIGFDGYIWYAAYRGEINNIIINHILDNGYAFKNGVYDVVSLFEIFKLKSSKADIISHTLNTKESLVEVYPNPFRDSLIIQFNDRQYTKMILIDGSGKELWRMNILPNQNTINLKSEIRDLKDGIYTLVLQGNDSEVRKIIRK